MIAERTTSWAYYLADGQGTIRQLTNASGEVTFLRSHDPFGQVLRQIGTGNLAWGYFGGLLDAAMGLIYVGNGQYYDPLTGRFLTPNGDERNPYVPLADGNPLHASMGAIIALSLLLRRRRNKSKGSNWSLLLVFLVGITTGLVACGTNPPPPITQTPPSNIPVPPTQPAPIVVLDKAREFIGYYLWQNPPTNDFFQAFWFELMDPDDIVTMNCWEMVLLAAYQSNTIDETWIKSFYETAYDASVPDQSIWTQLGAFSARPLNESLPQPGELIFFTPEGAQYPTHVALSSGGDNMISLWSGPDSIPYVQETTIERMLEFMAVPTRVSVGKLPWR